MLWQPTTLLAALLATAPAVQAGIGSLIVEGMTRDSPAYHRRMEEIMGSYLLRRGFLEERQAELSASSIGQDPIFTADGTLNMTAWNAQVNAACISQLRQLTQASNPSGTCVCYNLPALDNSTGVFEADLRLFRISDARDNFAGIAPEKIMVGVRFVGANVRTANPDQPVAGAAQASQGAAAAAAAAASTTSSQAETASPSSGAAVGAASVGRVGRSGDGEAANKLAARQTLVQDLPSNGDPTLLQQYLFVGKIDADKMTGEMSMAQLQHLLLPIVTLSGISPQGTAVSTNISSNEAAFVAGVFSKEVVLSDFNRAQLAVEDEIARLKNGTTAFVLPGVQILVFPIGLIITSVWLVIGVVAYGYGTFVRYNFAVQYKQRKAVVERGGMARI